MAPPHFANFVNGSRDSAGLRTLARRKKVFGQVTERIADSDAIGTPARRAARQHPRRQ